MRIGSIISTMAAALLLWGCNPEPESEPAKFEVLPASLNAPAEGGQLSFMVLCTGEEWMARTDGDSWMTLLTVKSKASADAVPVKVNVQENLTTARRTATITVTTMSGQKQTVSVSQAEGTGTSVATGITSAEDLLAFAKAFNEGSGIGKYKVGGEIRLMNDIDASSIGEWVPIGTQSMPFGEIFNADGHSIKNVHWTVDTDKYPNAGFIGYAKNATVSNFTFGSEGSTVGFTGRGATSVGGIVGYAVSTKVLKVENRASLNLTPASASVRFGGICGYLDAQSVLGDATLKSKGCVNSGNLLCSAPCLEGGIAGTSAGTVINCTNEGAILGKSATNAGPTWGCATITKKDGFTNNYGYGYVGDYDKFKDSPASARPAVHATATLSSPDYYDVNLNTVDWTLDTYYDWDVLEEKQVHPGLKYSHCSFTGINRHVHILEIDLSNPSIELVTAFADELIPNPNGNKNSNNGKNLRETLSDVCGRRRSEGQNIIAGVNSGFFDSNDGIARGYHVEEGEPVYVNNPDVSGALGNHAWALTVFTDNTASCGKKALTTALEAGGKSFRICSVNDTILRHVSAKYEVNMYTSRYKQYPHPEKKTLINDLAANALYVVAQYTGSPVTVNTGWAEAKVVSVSDGRTSKLTALPYISAANQVGFAVSGSAANTLAALKAGDTVRLKFDMTIDGESKPIRTQNSSMYKLMTDGKDETNSPGSSSSLYTTFDPMTFPVVSFDRKKVWLIEIDGRQPAYSIGVKSYEMYRIAKKLGGAEMTRFDGGGSSGMWLYDESKRSGSIVNRVSDSKGERSCMNYMLVRLKQ